jgi:large subunit ribosomal protein L10
LKRAEKENVVQALNEKFSKAQAVVLTDYRGLDTAAMNELRVRLREAAVEYQVVKNTLMSRASEGTDMALLSEHFVGPSAIAVSYDDPVAPAKVLTKFGKDYPALELKAGVLGGKAVNVEGLQALSKLPSREELLSQLLSVFNGPARSFVSVLSAVPRGFLNVLNAVKEQKESQGS